MQATGEKMVKSLCKESFARGSKRCTHTPTHKNREVRGKSKRVVVNGEITKAFLSEGRSSKSKKCGSSMGIRNIKNFESGGSCEALRQQRASDVERVQRWMM